MNSERDEPQIGECVLLRGLPLGFLDDLPEEDQRAVTAMLGKPVTLVGWDETGAAEFHFGDPFDPPTEDHSHTHSIWLAPEFITRLVE